MRPPATRRSPLRAAVALVLLTASLVSCAHARPIVGRVLWANEDRVYVASVDTTRLSPGEQVTFTRRGRPVATGRVAESLHAGELVMVTLTSGSLERAGKLEQLGMTAEQAGASGKPSLRVGIPAGGRSNLLFACPYIHVVPPLDAYRVESVTGGARLVRDSSTASMWPETLTVLTYAEAADEEIALERGELDVAVFWPGELSTHMRESRRWQNPLLGARSRGLVVASSGDVAIPNLAIPTPDNTTLSALNQMFRGDLAVRPAWPRGNPTTRPIDSVRFVADAALPGRVSIQRALDSRTTDNRRRSVVTVGYANASPDSVSAGVAPLFAIRCPVVCAVDLKEYVRTLGADRFADLPACSPPWGTR